jgi:hypothetical protein
MKVFGVDSDGSVAEYAHRSALAVAPAFHVGSELRLAGFPVTFGVLPNPKKMNSTVEPRVSAAPASLWEDFVDIYVSPSVVFARRSDGRFGLALVILTVIMAGLFYVSQAALASAFDVEFARVMARASSSAAEINTEQLEQMRSMSGIFATLAVLVSFPVGVFLTGLALWLAGKIFDSTATFAMGRDGRDLLDVSARAADLCGNRPGSFTRSRFAFRGVDRPGSIRRSERGLAAGDGAVGPPGSVRSVEHCPAGNRSAGSRTCCEVGRLCRCGAGVDDGDGSGAADAAAIGFGIWNAADLPIRP